MSYAEYDYYGWMDNQHKYTLPLIVDSAPSASPTEGSIPLGAVCKATGSYVYDTVETLPTVNMAPVNCIAMTSGEREM